LKLVTGAELISLLSVINTSHTQCVVVNNKSVWYIDVEAV